MKRKVLSLITALALCLGLCPVGALAADREPGGKLCPHHPTHTDECGYVLPAPGRDCTHNHGDGCYTVETSCIHQHTAECYSNQDDAPEAGEPDLCGHICTEDSGCVTRALSCPHEHDDTCGYAPASPGEPCAFACKICPVNDLVDKLPSSLSADNSEQVQAQLDEIFELYDGLAVDEQEQVDLSPCVSLMDQIAELSAGVLEDDPAVVEFQKNETFEVPYEVSHIQSVDTKEFALLAPDSTAIQIKDGGKLYFKGRATSKAHIGIEVQSGGALIITDPDTEIFGSTYALDIAAGADVQLSAGTYTSKYLAIQVEDGNFAALLAPGCAYFDESGNQLSPEDVKERDTVVVKQAPPEIKWNIATKELEYDGSISTIKDKLLPHIIITASNSGTLSQKLQYAYRSVGDTAFTDGLPLNVGEYEIKAYLPADQNYSEIATKVFLKLTIKAIEPLLTPPQAADLTYNGSSQALVTPGVADSRAAGAEILYATSQSGEYSTTIPTGIDAKSYEVWYKVEGNGNYNDAGPTQVSDVKIKPKQINPRIEPAESSFVYDGSNKKPVITVKDGDTVLDESQYTVTWVKDSDSTTVDHITAEGKYTAAIQNVTGGNYTFTASARLEIVPADQLALSITGQPAHVCYGDEITTLDTTGGTGNGQVEWSISRSDASASGTLTIDEKTGVFKVTDVGKFTVTAKRTVPNYGTVQDTWSFTVEPKPVTAEVTVTGKAYDGNTAIPDSSITAAVKTGDLVGNDQVSITGLKGSYADANAGTGKTVTLDSTYATATNTDKYTVSYPATATGDIKPREVDVTVTLSDHDLKTDNSTTPPGYSYVFDGNEKRPAVSVTGVDGAYSATLEAGDYTVDYANNKNVSSAGSSATVTVTAKAGGNYIFDAETVQFTIKEADSQLTGSPQARDLTYIGPGVEQELVTVGTASGGHIEYSLDGGSWGTDIPKAENAGTYTVAYKVVGDGNHTESGAGSVSVTIKPKEITPKITLDPNAPNKTYTYDATTAHKPDVLVQDVIGGNAVTVAATEYDVAYRDNVNAGTATVVVSDVTGGNYIINGTRTFTIKKAESTFTKEPEAQTGLQYSGAAQELVTVGGSAHGTVVYSLDGGNYSPVLPTATAVSTYTVSYKIQGDKNHEDTAPVDLSVKIDRNVVNNPTISLSSDTFKYNGSQQKPAITVYDDSSVLIPEHEYTVKITDAAGNAGNAIDKGVYTVTITTLSTSNYDITSNNTRTFTIVEANQETMSITGTQVKVCYGDVIQLGTTSGVGGSTVTWKVTGGTDGTTITQTGLLTVKDINKPILVTAERTADNYDTVSATWEFTAGKKAVAAVLTGVDRVYDKDSTTTTVKAEVPESELAFAGDSITISDLTGTFADPDAGTDKKVTVGSSNPTVTGNNCEKYDIAYPATTTASITKANVTGTTPPVPVLNLEYTGKPQELVTAGSATGGAMEYSLDGRTYSASLPKGTDASDYDVWYRVKGDGNHNDTTAVQLAQKVTIKPQEVTAPIIELTPNSVSYDGGVHQPSVTVKDKYGRVIPDIEYTVTLETGRNWKDVGTYDVTVTDKNGGNYTITGKTEKFEILIMGQSPLSIVNKPGQVYYGDTFTLSTSGGSGMGTVSWLSDNPNIATIDQNGLVTTKKAGGPVTIRATKDTDNNYGATSVAWTFSVEKKPVTAIVTAKDKEYDGSDEAKLAITWQGLLNGDTAPTLNLTGTFDSANVGNNKTVTITGTVPTSDKYDISYNATTTASITPAAATVTAPTPLTLTYDGTEQDLVSAGSTTDGDIVYSLDGAIFDTAIPKKKNAGKYTVWYKARGDADHKDSAVGSVSVTIQPKTVTAPALVIELSPEEFGYDGNPKKPDVIVKDNTAVIPASEYTVSYKNNVAAANANDANAPTVTVTSIPDGNYIINGSKTFAITASAAALITPPEGMTLTYNGNDQALVRSGTALNGQVAYSLTENAADYKTSIPTAVKADTYTVYYKVQGNTGYSDTAVGFVTAVIQPKPVTPAITLDSDSMAYTGSPVTPGVTVVVEGRQLTENADYTVEYIKNQNVGTATVIVQNVSGTNYQFYATKTFEIVKDKAEFDADPEGRAGLVYNGTAQELIEELTGISLEGIVLYSLDAQTYSAEIPTGTKARKYTVYAKIQGDSTHADSDVFRIPVTIDKNNGNNLAVSLSATQLNYTGNELRPTVTVTDDSGNMIPASDYTVSYSDNVNVGKTAAVTVTGKAPNCTEFIKTANFEIVGADQPTLTITGKPEGTIYYGDTFQLKTTGGASGSTVTWTSSDTDVATIAGGMVTVKKAGSTVIKASITGNGNYTGTVEDSWTLFAQPRPLTVTVTAKSRPYDAGKLDADLIAVINSGLVPGETDTVTVAAMGQFMDGNAGDNKTVIIQRLTVTPEDKYAVVNPGTATASITPVAASVDTQPAALAPIYNGREQPLVSAGSATGGNLAYSLNGINYTFIVPKGKDVGSYDVWYKAVASDNNYKDSAPKKVETEIKVNTVANPEVICTPDEFQYDGTMKTPTVTVKDDAGQIIPNTEYTVSVDKTAIAADTYTVTVTPGSNYQFTGSATGTFEIIEASQSSLTIVSTIPSDIHYGDSFYLSVTGGSGNGAIQWSIKEANGVARVDSYGEMAKVTITGVGTFTVEAYREAEGGYSQSNTISVPLEAKPKPITPVVKANDKPYDGERNATLSASVRESDLVGGDQINLSGVGGQFDTPDVGDQKQVQIVPGTATGANAAKYNIIWPNSVTASITRVNVELEPEPAGLELTYNGNAQALLSGGSTRNNIGTIVYSFSEKDGYSTDIPKGTEVGIYQVWYKVEDTVNYMGISAREVKAEIKADAVSPGPGSGDDPGSTDTDTTPAPSTPGESSTSSTASAPMNTTVRNGAANTVVSATEGSRLVREAVANGSEAVVIKPEITGDVSKAEVSVPASTLSQLERQTDANLVVSTPIADVTIPNGALSTLSSVGGAVDVVTERTEHGVVLTLSADGKPVDSVPGGVTLTVPAAEAGPGAVAVLVHPDGTRETIRKSVAVDGVMSIPMSGSGTVEIVDNSKAFTDVPDTSWEAGAVAFASAHEMFSGTSETTFSPEQPMSRGMLATVLYNLEGKPDQDQPCTFSDISGDDWYADSVAWATENGIASGYGDGQFGPDDSITREQFAVMLWKYAGSPETDGAALAFTDAGQVSGYALEALRWATENGILNGYSSGQLDPGGIATRAQAAQMLKNFMENT